MSDKKYRDYKSMVEIIEDGQAVGLVDAEFVTKQAEQIAELESKLASSEMEQTTGAKPNMEKIVELKMCPFCGGEAHLIREASENFVQCSTRVCPLSCLKDCYVDEWNARAYEQEIEPLNKTIEGLKHQIANDTDHIHSCMMCSIFERQACREQHKGLEQEIKELQAKLAEQGAIKQINELIQDGHKDYARDLEQVGSMMFDDGLFWICSPNEVKDGLNVFYATDGSDICRKITIKVSECLKSEITPPQEQSHE